MSVKPIMSGGILVEVEPRRYDELVRKEERLNLLENAIKQKDDFSNIEDIKTIFNLKKEVPKNED